MVKPKVILRQCPDYDPGRISRIIAQGLEDFGLAPRVQGRVTIKPNVVFAHHRVAPSAYTRSEFVDGLLTALEAKAAPDTRFTITEKCGAAIPTSRMLRHAGYYRLKRTHRVRIVPIEEAKKVKVPLTRGVLHEEVHLSRDIARRDLLVYAPKLKSNVLAHGLTGSIKLNIGILCEKERMWNHNYRLDDKIVDLLEVGRPDFIVTDGIEAAVGGNQLTEPGKPLGVIILASDPLAHDVVCAHILHLDPETIGHLRQARDRGYGTLDVGGIDLQGDITLDEARERTRDWDLGFMPVTKVPGNFKVLSGEPYCTGGCQGVLLDWLYMIKDRKPRLWNDLPHWTTVVGVYKGDVTAKRLLLLGTCTKIEGRIRARRRIRIRGCPPKHKTLVLLLFLRAGIVNPLFRLDLILDSYFFLFLSWLRRIVKERIGR
jgi:uncharacterized protein (DUF362 family)